MNHIIDNLYLGSWQSCRRVFKNPNWITITLAIDSPIQGNFFFPLEDSAARPEDGVLFLEALKALERSLETGKNVLVHCVCGVNRSVGITLAFLMKTKGFSLQQAFDFVASKRKNIQPNKNIQHLACLAAAQDRQEIYIDPNLLNENEKIVNELYKKILFRNADPDGLEHYSYRLTLGVLSVDELREILLNSEERKKKKID